jgi:hypothetical protein
MSDHDDLQKTEETMRGLAQGIDEVLEKATGQKKGFALVVFEFGQPGLGNYISNARREDMVAALRETADRIEKRETIPPAQGSA